MPIGSIDGNSFDKFFAEAQRIQQQGQRTDKSVMRIDSSGGQSFTVGTQTWQTLGSRSDAYKSQNLRARAVLLQALKAKYDVNDITRLPKAVLDALNISDFGLDENGKVTSERPLTARRIIAIHTAMSTVGKLEDDPLFKEVNAVKNNIPDKLTADDDPHWQQLLEIDKLSPADTKGKTLLIFGQGDVFRYARGQKDSFGDLFLSGETVRSVDTRFGSRFALFRDLMNACGGDETFAESAIRKLKLDARNPVYDDLPLDVAQSLIRRAKAIRERSNTEIEQREQPQVKTEIRRITPEQYAALCSDNKAFLDGHLGKVVEQVQLRLQALEQSLENKDMPVGHLGAVKSKVSQLRSILVDLKSDLKLPPDTRNSQTYNEMVNTLKDLRHVYSFGAHSENVRVEFLSWAAEQTVEERTDNGYGSNDDGSARPPTGYEAENARNDLDLNTVYKVEIVEPRKV